MTDEPRRHSVSPDVVKRLAALVREQQSINSRVQTYLAGVTDALGLDPAQVMGLDDETGELLLVPDTPL